MSPVPDTSVPALNTPAPRTAAQRWSAPAPSAVEARLSYLVPGSAKPVQYAYEPPPGVPWESGHFEDVSIRIGDARRRDGQPSIQREGFELWNAPTALRLDHDDDAIRRLYYPELETLVLSVTGGHRAYVFDHLVRRREPHHDALDFGRAKRGETAAPNGRIHTDYTERSGLRRLGLVLDTDMPAGIAPRYCIVNVWRSLRGPVLDTPLAVCDARSVDAGELIEAEVRYPRRQGEIYLVAHAARHQWWYYSGMDVHEALIFKQYDSRLGGVSRFVPHAAFAHPDAPKDAPPRISIEARCLVLFD